MLSSAVAANSPIDTLSIQNKHFAFCIAEMVTPLTIGTCALSQVRGPANLNLTCRGVHPVARTRPCKPKPAKPGRFSYHTKPAERAKARPLRPATCHRNADLQALLV